MDYNRLRFYLCRFACLYFSALMLCVPALAAPDQSEAVDVNYVVSPDVSMVLVETYDAVMPMAADDGFPFYGSSWISGTASGLGEVTVFFPINRQDGYIGVDASGRIMNVSDSSFSGVMYDDSGNHYTVSFSSFTYPRYRDPNGSSYTYIDLYLTPNDGNVLLPNEPSPIYSVSDLLPFVSILLLGGVLLCCMRKS